MAVRPSKKRRLQLRRKSVNNNNPVQRESPEAEEKYQEEEYDEQEEYQHDDDGSELEEPYVGMTIAFPGNSFFDGLEEEDEEDEEEDNGNDNYNNNGDEDEEDDREAFTKQVLPVPEHIASNGGDPTDGLEYLYLVRKEASGLPNISSIRLSKNPSFISSSRTVTAHPTPTHKANVSQTLTKSSSMIPALPSEEWRSIFLDRFNQVRQIVTESKEPLSYTLDSSYYPIPSSKDENSWREYIFGKNEPTIADGNGNPLLTDNTKNHGDESSMDIGESSEEEQENSNSNDQDQDQGYQDEYVEFDIDNEEEEEEEEEDDGTEKFSCKRTMIFSTPKKHNQPRRKPNTFKSLAATAQFVLSSSTNENKQQEHSSSSSSSWNKKVWPNHRAPCIALMRSLDLKTRICLLSYLDQWLQQSLSEYDRKTSTERIIMTPEYSWIMSLLSSLNSVLIGSHISTLRSIGKTCRQILSVLFTHQQSSSLSSASAVDHTLQVQDQEGACWMIITVVAGVWGQSDLLYDFD